MHNHSVHSLNPHTFLSHARNRHTSLQLRAYFHLLPASNLLRSPFYQPLTFTHAHFTRRLHLSLTVFWRSTAIRLVVCYQLRFCATLVRSVVSHIEFSQVFRVLQFLSIWIKKDIKSVIVFFLKYVLSAPALGK